MNRPLSPSSMPPPAARYAHAVLTERASRWLHTSGVVPIDADGTVPEGVAEQAALVWRHLGALLAEAGMETTDVVSITTYVVASEMAGLPAVMAARDRALDGRLVASTLVTVPALARQEWLLEIALVAAR